MAATDVQMFMRTVYLAMAHAGQAPTTAAAPQREQRPARKELSMVKRPTPVSSHVFDQLTSGPSQLPRTPS